MRGQIRALDAEFWLGLRDARRLVGNLYLGYETAKYYWEHYADNVGSWRDLPSCSSLTKCVCGADEARAAAKESAEAMLAAHGLTVDVVIENL